MSRITYAGTAQPGKHVAESFVAPTRHAPPEAPGVVMPRSGLSSAAARHRPERAIPQTGPPQPLGSIPGRVGERS
jgi:hypothetical protein